MRSMRRILTLASLAALAGLATNAAANQSYHTLHAPLVAVNGSPLQQGWVNDIHMNGNVNGAQEVYHLAGASPNTDYHVVIQFYTNDTTCTTTPFPITTAALTTNAGGNADATFNFPASPRPRTNNPQFDSAIWQIQDSGNTVHYATGCHLVIIGAAK